MMIIGAQCEIGKMRVLCGYCATSFGERAREQLRLLCCVVWYMCARVDVHACCVCVRACVCALLTLPDAISLTWCLTPAPRSTLLANVSPSTSGVPTELENSGGAAPVPPSPPSMVIKSGYLPGGDVNLTG